MPGHDIICIGASAGGVEVLVELVKHLPKDLPAAILVVVHVAPNSSTVLAAVLNRAGNLPAAHATPDEPLRRGRIYVARPDFHLLLRNGGLGRIVLGRGPKENSARPAVDPLFRTAARAYGRRVVGVILSGSLDDGTVGLDVIKRMGGVTIVQDPETALFPSMPRSAIENVDVDHVVPPNEIPELLVRLANEPVGGAAEAESEAAMPDEIKQEADMAELDEGSIKDYERPGTPSGFTCPECHGTLFELSKGQLIRFRCRTGHAFSAESLMAEQGDNLEAAMWTALTALKERAALATRLADRAGSRGHDITERQFRQQASNGPGKGSTFTIELPGAVEPTDAGDASEPSNGRAAGRLLRILLVEDHADTARITGRLLRRLGHTVFTVSTVADGVAVSERESLDLVLSDLGLPDGTGIDMLRRIRHRHSVPAIALSGYGMEDDVRRSLAAGFRKHLTKPVSFSSLQDAIESVT